MFKKLEARVLGFDLKEDIESQCRGRYRGRLENDKFDCDNLSFIGKECKSYQEGYCIYKMFLEEK